MEERHPKNSLGPFYVVNGECISCGAPEAEAPDLMAHDDATSHCFFRRQPETLEEVDSAIRATWASCCGAVRYGGNDKTILRRFAQLGNTEACDNKLIWPPRRIARNAARLLWESKGEISINQTRSDIFAQITHLRESKYTSFEEHGTTVRYRWGVEKENSIIISLDHELRDFWLLELIGNPVAELGTAIWIDGALRSSSRLQSIRWFKRTQITTRVVPKNIRTSPQHHPKSGRAAPETWRTTRPRRVKWY